MFGSIAFIFQAQRVNNKYNQILGITLTGDVVFLVYFISLLWLKI